MIHVRYTDPRVLTLFSHYKWQDSQRDLLEGRRSWGSPCTPAEQKSVRWMMTCLRERGITFKIEGDAMLVGTAIPLPEPDPFLDRFIALYGLTDLPATILSLDHVEDCEGVPICKGVIYGSTGGIVGSEPTRYGLQADVFMVGRLDVRDVGRRSAAWSHAPNAFVHTVQARGHMRRTLKRARFTARRIAAAIPDWEAYQAQQAILECHKAEAAEAADREAAAAAMDDDEIDAIAGAF